MLQSLLLCETSIWKIPRVLLWMIWIVNVASFTCEGISPTNIYLDMGVHIVTITINAMQFRGVLLFDRRPNSLTLELKRLHVDVRGRRLCHVLLPRLCFLFFRVFTWIDMLVLILGRVYTQLGLKCKFYSGRVCTLMRSWLALNNAISIFIGYKFTCNFFLFWDLLFFLLLLTMKISY